MSSVDPRDVLSEDPFNAECPMRALRSPLTPLDHFYVRSNFSAPGLTPDSWQLRVHGAVGEEWRGSLADLKALGEATRIVTFECAGNGRTMLEPQVPGTPWTLGATGTAEFVGVPLRRLLDRVRPADDAVELVFSGADRGEREGWGEIAFQRSLPIHDALGSSVGEGDVHEGDRGPLLAWQMNGQPLPTAHGGPVRLVVPGWYAVASVKWLVDIEAVRRPFEGHFQTDRYLYHEPGGAVTPVRHMRVRALLLDPDPETGGDAAGRNGGLTIDAGEHVLSGIAWTGAGEIAGVRVSVDGGREWDDAELIAPPLPGAPARWRLSWTATPGEHEIVVRARDTRGAEQPLEPWWNELGYGNNSVQRIPVRVI